MKYLFTIFYLILTFVLGFFAAWLYEWFAVTVLRKDALIILGWRLHHSLFGLGAIFLYMAGIKRLFFLGFGLGIVVQHTITDGFRFVSK